ncbi:hypothetical protein [Streptosporangium sp. NPDC000396]|uniref:hypothetical protein n=1 Tax=Streptosporangium sp. NPDC000396 TaxID=3366185 RepID=UPI0036A4A618
MRRKNSFLLVAFLASVLVVAAPPAWAKGVDSAILTGPGLSAPVTVKPSDPAASARLSTLRMGTAIDTALISELPGRFQSERPSGRLGPGYRLAWHAPGEQAEVVQDLYPYALPAPVVHTPSQKLVVRTGWYRAPAFLKDTLTQLGLPAEPPAGTALTGEPGPAATSGPPGWIWGAATGLAAGIAFVAFVALRRRRANAGTATGRR